MLTDNHVKEGLSRAYVQAIGARAGIIVSMHNRSHDYGIDGSFHAVSLINNRRTEIGITLDFQLKATSCPVFHGENISFPLDADIFNSFGYRAKNPVFTPAILIVLILPSNPEEWVELSEDELILRKCCYWTSIYDLTPNLYSANVKIPTNQVLTPERLKQMLKNIEERLPVC